ncbi:MAG TPA: transglutaminase domain-containing protein [Hanamia sp.]|nr:transglutaminase domain-containing protein [Hanamia sp.]
MRFLIIIIGFIFFANDMVAQRENIYHGGQVIMNIPAAQTNTTADIATYIKNHFDSDVKRIHAIYIWVTHNIKYDKDSIHRVILDEDNEERVSYSLKKRRGVCEDFAAIFTDICEKSGISSFAIEGKTKQNGLIDRTPHVWCAALINNKWSFYDPTWDAGYVSGGSFISQVGTNYFQISPEDFIQYHLPYDPLFQFLNYPVSYKEFYKGTSQPKNFKTYFNYKDSLQAYLQSDSLSKYASSLLRIEHFDWPASIIDNKLKRIKLEIELIYQDRDMALYDSAIADYNKGIEILNDFINYRNNQFQPAKTNGEVQQMFRSITQKISGANQKLVKVNKSKATLTLNTGGIQQKLDELASAVKEEQNFYKDYVNKKKVAIQ